MMNAEMPPGAGHSFPSFSFQHTATEKMIIKNGIIKGDPPQLEFA